MEDERWEPGMPVLDRQAVPVPGGGTVRRATGELPASLANLPPRSVPETAPTPLQRQFINLSFVALICGAVAITALELGATFASPLVKLCVLVGAPIIIVTTADASVRIFRSAVAWLPVNRGRGLFRLAWLIPAAVLIAVAIGALAVVLPA